MQQIDERTLIRHYDPRPQDEEQDVDSVVWTTKSVNYALEMIKMGQSLERSPFWMGKIDRRRGDLVFHLTDNELAEWQKCAADILYFIEKYIKVKIDTGQITNITLRRYQYQQILDYMLNDEIILGWSRQSGKTVGTSIFILWCCIFQPNRSVAILANKSTTSHEVLAKIQDIYKYLPFFLKPGVYGWNTKAVSFDNGSKIFTGPTTDDALNGKTCNILYIDEFAYIGKGKNKIEFQRNFLANQMPILSAQKNSGLCKLIISSTPVGKEFFWELIDNAAKGKNSFKLSIVKWWQIPGRDVEWAKKEISKLNSVTKFRQQYEMSFNVNANSLLESSTMKHLYQNSTNFEQIDGIIDEEWTEYLTINESIELAQDSFICFSVDIAEGLGNDYSVIQILQLNVDEDEIEDEIVYKQIGKFRCNSIPIDELAKVTKQLMIAFSEDTTKLLVESNTYGDYFFKCFDSYSEYDVPAENVLMFKRSADASSATRGLRTNANIKNIAVKSFKLLTDKKILRFFDKNTIQEVENFQDNGKGQYCATIGHDDEVTPLINFAYWISLSDVAYNNWIEDFLEYSGIEYSYEDEDDE